MNLLAMLALGCATTRPPVAVEAPAPEAPLATVEAPASAGVDVIPTGAGDLRITPVYHGTLVLEHGGTTFWVDPWSEAPLDGLPRANVVLITDLHPDHLDPDAVTRVKGPDAIVVGPAAIADTLEPDVILANGETREVAGVSITAVPMYNLVRGPAEGQLFHDKGRGNGYLLDLAGTTVYIAGDTECTPEMRALTGVDVAFIPMNLPYTMPPEEAADCIEAFRPSIVYPYHYRGSELSILEDRLADDADIELRVRDWYPAAP